MKQYEREKEENENGITIKSQMWTKQKQKG